MFNGVQNTFHYLFGPQDTHGVSWWYRLNINKAAYNDSTGYI